jgi:hypothetical protein
MFINSWHKTSIYLGLKSVGRLVAVHLGEWWNKGELPRIPWELLRLREP